MRLKIGLSLVAVSVTALTAAGGVLVAAAPASADVCLLPSVCIPTGGSGGGSGTFSPSPSSATFSPASLKNTDTSVTATINDQLTQVYDSTGGETVQLVNSTDSSEAINPTAGPQNDDTANTITATFDFVDGSGMPLDPGDYTLVITPVSASQVLSLLAPLGVTSLPADNVSGIPIGADAPTPYLSRTTVAPGASAKPLTIGDAVPSGSAVPFARKDAVSLTDSGGHAVTGLDFSNAVVSAHRISGEVAAGSQVPLGAYDVRVTDAAGQVGVCSGCLDVGTVYKDRLTLSASAKHLVAGHRVMLAGRLTHTVPGKGSKGLAGVPVVLTARTDRNRTVRLGSITTGSGGRYRVGFRPGIDARYAARYLGRTAAAGTAGETGARSGPVLVKVASLVTARAVHAVTRRTQPLVVSGAVSPDAAGRVVRLVRVVKGHVVKVASAKVARHSTYTIRTARLPKGRYRLQVRIGARPGNAAGRSRTFRIRRT